MSQVFLKTSVLFLGISQWVLAPSVFAGQSVGGQRGTSHSSRVIEQAHPLRDGRYTDGNGNIVEPGSPDVRTFLNPRDKVSALNNYMTWNCNGLGWTVQQLFDDQKYPPEYPSGFDEDVRKRLENRDSNGTVIDSEIEKVEALLRELSNEAAEGKPVRVPVMLGNLKKEEVTQQGLFVYDTTDIGLHFLRLYLIVLKGMKAAPTPEARLQIKADGIRQAHQIVWGAASAKAFPPSKANDPKNPKKLNQVWIQAAQPGSCP